jgi:hypothetical protein
MSDDNRIDRFRNELADLKTAGAKRNVEQLLVWLSILLMVGGIALAFGAYISSHGSSADNLGVANQNDMQVLAMAGIACSVVGAALFLRYSFARFLRFWMLRQLYEGRAAAGEVETRVSEPAV